MTLRSVSYTHLDLLEVAKKAGLDIKAARTAAEDIRECVKENLKEYLYV